MPPDETIELDVLPRLRPDAFTRDDEEDDRAFYRDGRPEPPLDRLALDTARDLIGQLLEADGAAILDLAAGGDSHLPDGATPARLVGLGLDEPALRANPALTEVVVHDLNAVPALPFPAGHFDAVLCSFAVEYLTRPFDIFDHVSRVLRPGGLFVVLFSNRKVRRKATRFFRDAPEQRRAGLVHELLMVTSGFERLGRFEAVGRPRPADDEFADTGLPSDPIYAVWADRSGAPADRPARPRPASIRGVPLDREAIEARKRAVGQTLRCPYCEQPLTPWPVPQTPFTEWSCEEMYVCLDNRCPYYCGGWSEMDRQGNRGYSYRLMYNPDLDRCLPTPVAGLGALRSGQVLPRG